MRIFHITETHELADGGLTTAVNSMLKLMAREGHVAGIFATGRKTLVPENIVRYGKPPPSIGKSWQWSPRLRDDLRGAILEFQPDIIHTHGCWMAPQFFGLKRANRLGIPTIASYHNFLDPWLLDQQGPLVQAKKQIYWQFVARKVFSKVNIHHAITKKEFATLRKYLPHGQITTIPIPIEDIESCNIRGKMLREDAEDCFVFLGRVARVKALDQLIAGFARAGIASRWKLIIAGPVEDQEYSAELDAIARQMGVAEAVSFIGPVMPENKWSIINRAWAICLPSHTEVNGLVNLEAAICGVPTITTPGTGLIDWESHGGLLAEPNAEALSACFRMASQWSQVERMRRGMLLREHVLATFSTRQLASRWTDTYQSVINESKNIFNHSNKKCF